MARGEIRWYTFRAPDKRQPVLLLTRDAVLNKLGEVIVVPVTRTVRGLKTEVVLTPEEGMPVACAVNFDHIGVVQVRGIGPIVATFPESRWDEAREAMLAACGFDEE